MALPQDVEGFLSLDLSDEEYNQCMQAILQQMRSGSPSIMQLVVGMESQLTTTVDPERSRATLLLAEVMAQAPELLQAGQLSHMASFFADRLSDWKCLRPTLKGCEALLARKQEGSVAPLAGSDVAIIADAFMKGVHVQSLQAVDRQQAFRMLLITIQDYSAELSEAGVDLLEMAIRSIDTEKDPRCLLLAFQCVCQLAAHRVPGELDQWEELHSCISCYFPVSFHPPPGKEKQVTRDDIVQGLKAAMTSHPCFAPLSVPLLLEKATSPSKRDLKDSMDGLVACCQSWGAGVMSDHLPEIWTTLQIHLMGEDEEDAALAAECLRGCCGSLCPAAGGPSAMSTLVLDGQQWTTWMADLQSLAATDGIPSSSAVERASSAVGNTCRVLAAVAAGDSHSTLKALGIMMPILMDIALDQKYISGMKPCPAASAACVGIALASVRTLVKAANKLAFARELEPTAHPLGGFCKDLIVISVRDAQAEDIALSMEPPAAIMRLQVLDDLLCAKTPPLLSSHQQSAALQRLLEIIEGPDATAASASASISLGPNWEPSRKEDAPALACKILSSAGGSLSGCELYESGLHRLLAAVADDGPGGRDWGGAWPLRAVLAMSEADTSAREKAMHGLGELVAGQLLVSADASSATSQGACLVPCLDTLEAQYKQSATDGGQMAPLGDAELANDLLKAAARAVELAGTLEGGPSDSRVWSRCARVASRAVTSSAEDSQARVAAAALDSVLAQTSAPAGPSAGWLAMAGPVALSILQVVPWAVMQAVALDRMSTVLQTLLGLCCSPGPCSTPAAIALASLANKCPNTAAPEAQGGTIGGQAISFLAQRLSEEAQPEGCCASLRTLGWLARALAMRGEAEEASRALELIRTFVSDSHPLSQALDCLDTATFAHGYVFSRDSEGMARGTEQQQVEAWGRDVLSRKFGCSCRVLWEQRTFSAQLRGLQSRIQEVTGGGKMSMAKPQLQALQLMALEAMSLAPRGAFQQEFGTSLPLLLDALLGMPQCQLPSAQRVLPPALDLLEWLLPDQTWGPKVAERAEAVVHALTSLCPASAIPFAGVRTAALHCLTLVVTHVDYSRLHPLVKQVRWAIDGCLDDPKRPVRRAAVRARHMWAK